MQQLQVIKTLDPPLLSTICLDAPGFCWSSGYLPSMSDVDPFTNTPISYDTIFLDAED